MTRSHVSASGDKPNTSSLLNLTHQLIALVLTLSTSAFAGLNWDQTTCLIRTTPDAGSVVGVFRFTNNGSVAVRILETVSTCECTVTQSEDAEVAPGGSGEIKVRFVLAGRTGLQRKTIEVLSNDPQTPRTTLNLHVQIDPQITISPGVLWWRIGGEARTQSVRVTAPEGAPAWYVGVQCSNPLWRVALKTEVYGRQYTIEATPSATGERGSALVTLEPAVNSAQMNTPRPTVRLRLQ